MPNHKVSSRTLISRTLTSHTLPSRALPSRALQLISEYSKPITRGDWRTFTRITMETYIKDKDKLDHFTNTRLLYELVHRNMYEHLYNMPKAELFWLIIDQFKIIKHHTILPLCDMTKLEMIYVEIQNEEIMKQPNYKQKKFFKNNEDLMQLYTKNNKLNINTRQKNNNTRYINNN